MQIFPDLPDSCHPMTATTDLLTKKMIDYNYARDEDIAWENEYF